MHSTHCTCDLGPNYSPFCIYQDPLKLISTRILSLNGNHLPLASFLTKGKLVLRCKPSLHISTQTHTTSIHMIHTKPSIFFHSFSSYVFNISNLLTKLCTPTIIESQTHFTFQVFYIIHIFIIEIPLPNQQTIYIPTSPLSP